MSKTFPFFGTATNDKGEYSVRGAADNVKRVVAMEKAGLSNIKLVQLPVPMTKLDACKHILNMPEFASAGYGAIKQYIENNDELYLPLEPVVTTDAPEIAADVQEPEVAETPAVVAEQADDAEEVSDAVYDNKIVDLGDDEDFGSDDYGLGDYADMIPSYDFD